jgi:membrane protein DedA with SNARE-associated domain
MIEGVIEYFSYGGLLVVLLLGSLGLPIPEEVPIVAAGMLSHQQMMRWWLALPACIVGVFAGDLILYWAGRHWGERVLDQPLIGRLLTRARLEQIQAGYRRRGALIVFLARNVMGLRAAAFVGAGVGGLPFWKFAAADGAAIGYGVPLNFGLAYLFSRHLLGDRHAQAAEEQEDQEPPVGEVLDGAFDHRRLSAAASPAPYAPRSGSRSGTRPA